MDGAVVRLIVMHDAKSFRTDFKGQKPMPGKGVSRPKFFSWYPEKLGHVLRPFEWNKNTSLSLTACAAAAAVENFLNSASTHSGL